MPPLKRRKVQDDAAMADMAGKKCLKAHREGRKFSLEHPKNSLARHLPSWVELEAEDGVMVTEYHTCMFEPSVRKKSQCLIHNIPELEILGKTCESGGICSRTGEKHKDWKPVVERGRVISFPTGEEREYPKGFCDCYAEAIRSRVKEEDFLFLEIFSGPNAPLSHSISKVAGETLSEPKRNIGGELSDWVEASRTSSKAQVNPKEGSITEKGGDEVLEEIEKRGQMEVETEEYKIHSVGAARQPSYGKRRQLIPDGLQSPEKHLSLAKELEHPFESLDALKDDHRRAVETISQGGRNLELDRLKKLQEIKTLVASCRKLQNRRNLKASWTAEKLGLRIQTEAMEVLQTKLGIEDREVPKACLEGLRITGEASESPFFERFEVSPSVTWEEYTATAAQRSKEMCDRVLFMGKKSDPKLAEAIWSKTQKEVVGGTMGPPMSLEQVQDKYGNDFQIVPSFGLAQGEDSKGDPKYRRIDDHSACWNNLVARRKQKVPMAMVDYVSIMFRALARAFPGQVLATTEDMKGAYRQVPLHPADVRYSITAVYNPHSTQVSCHEMFGQPFGAGHAVPNFCRVAEWMARLITRQYQCLCDHFFDDYWIIEPQGSIELASFCLKETFRLLGLTLDPDKTQMPATVCGILGVLFNTESLKQGKIVVSAKPSRIANLETMILGILARGELSPALAASVVGKFGFLCSTLFGKVGRCCTGALRARQYASHKVTYLTPQISISLKLMLHFIHSSPSREVPLELRAPIILYTDASDVPDRSPRFGLGAVLYDPRDRELLYTSYAVPNSLVNSWLPRSNYMGQLELLAAPLALETWRQRLTGMPVLLFIDNDSAASNLVKGYSPKEDSSAIVGHFWLQASQQALHVYVDRVESKSNPSDGPSRFLFEEIRAMGGSWSPPITGSLASQTASSLQWFGAPLQRGEKK